MALDAATAQEMIKKLAEDRATYLDTISRTHDLLATALAASATGKPQIPLTGERLRRNTVTTLATTTTDDVVTAPKDSNFSIDEDSDTDDDESLFVQQTLPNESYDEEGLRKHIKEYPWTKAGASILGELVENEELPRGKDLFPQRLGPVEDRSHLSHYSIFDVGNDGAPLPILIASERSPLSRALDIWQRIKSINADPARQKRAVGRITIVREPSPLLFAALHYTMKDHFDMDKIFEMLETNNKTKAFPHSPWADNPKHRNTFVFTFEYFTIVGDECHPMKWQKADQEFESSQTHVPVSRCSSIVALALEAPAVSKIRHRGRRNPLGRREGDVYDPFSPWHVLSMQAYPDWRSSVDSHDSTKHYVNGPEAFLMTLRAEFKDAQKRLMDVYNRISDLVTTPPEFMFNQSIRDKLLFEDDEFTYSRRYFWAYQSLAIMNEDIKEMIHTYKSTFTESVWNGSNRIIWPGDENSARHVHWRKRMELIRKDINHELRGLEDIDRLNDEKMKEIKGLRDNLFSGTSVLESRRSVQQQAITVVQGNNIKILTLVTIFFLPLTFVTSVFGMTNMDPQDNFIRFGIVTLVVCLPTYMLIGSLNTERGFEFWTQKIHIFFTRSFWKHMLASCLALVGVKPDWAAKYQARPDTRKALGFDVLQLKYIMGRTPYESIRSAFSSTSIYVYIIPRSISDYPDVLPATDTEGLDNLMLRPSLKPRSQSATDGMAARGDFGPTSPMSPISPGASGYPMSPGITLERHATVKFEPSIRSMDLHRSPTALNPDLQHARLRKGSTKADVSELTADDVNGSWISRLFGRKSKDEANSDAKEYP